MARSCSGGLYLGNEDNPYHALVKPKSNDIISCEIHPDAKVVAVDAFEECTALTSVSLGKGVTYID